MIFHRISTRRLMDEMIEGSLDKKEGTTEASLKVEAPAKDGSVHQVSTEASPQPAPTPATAQGSATFIGSA